MNTIKQLIEKYCPEGVEYKKLEEVCEILDSQRKPVAKGKREKGKYPYYGANGIQDYVNNYIFDGTYLLIGEDGSVINADKTPVLNWASGKIWVNNHAHILAEKDNAVLRFIYYALQCINVSDIVRGTPPKLNQANLRSIEIPVPPIPVQREIVRILDNFTSLVAELEAELEARRKQYEYYRDQLLSFKHLTGGGSNDVEWKTLGEIAEIRGRIGFRGYTRSDQVEKGQGALALTASNIINQNIDYNNSTYVTWEKYEESPEIMVHDGDIIVCQRGSIGKLALVNQLPQKATINPQLLLLKSIKCNNKYLRYYMTGQQFQKDLNKIKGIGTVQMISQSKFNGLCIPIPSMDIQHRIVSILDRFESLVNDITTGLPAEIAARHQQYEYYRDQLLTFKRKS